MSTFAVLDEMTVPVCAPGRGGTDAGLTPISR